MTAAKSASRGRRRTSASSVPRELAAWFGGEPVARRPLLFKLPHDWQVAECWRAWSADNPGAPPPAGWRWLADPDDPRHRRPPFVHQAVARCVAGG